MSHGEARIVISGKTRNENGKIRRYDGRSGVASIREHTGMHRLLKVVKSLREWNYSIQWDMSGESPVALVRWPDCEDPKPMIL